MSEIGGGSQESKINLAYERRIELAAQLKAVEQTRIDAELDLETKIHLMQEQEIANAKALAEADEERALRLAQLHQEQIKEITGPLLDGLAGQMAKLMTGQKTSFAKMLQSAGQSMATTGLKKLGQAGLD